ncbi:MAG: DUF2147 domain-containing protein [Bacteroidales bacterium]|nr:DUF2147 domain-containing protein [Bacteroidales bacterium]
MKKLITVILFCCLGSVVFAQKADDICGIYYMVDPFSKEGSQVEMYRASDGTYEAKVIWVENPKKKPYLGLVFLKSLVYNKEKNEYQDGVVKYPGKKGTFSMTLWIESSTKLKVRGYWGFAALGKTMYWTKEAKVRVQHD